MASSRSTSDLETLRQIGRERGYSEQEINQRLIQAGYDLPTSSLGQQFMHGLGAIGRMGVAGVGNMVSMPFGLLGAGYQAATGNTPPAILQGNQGTATANQLGLPQYQGAGERILGSAGENMVGTALFPGGTAGKMLALSGGAGVAGSGVSEAFGFGPFGQLAASLVVGGGFPVAGTVLSASIRAALAGASSKRAAAQQALQLVQAGNPNAAVTLGQVAEGGAARTIEGGLRNIPGSSGVIANTLETQAEEMGQRVEKIAESMGRQTTKEVAGQAAIRGIKGPEDPTRGLSAGFIPNFHAKSEELYGKVYSIIRPETPVTPTNLNILFAKQNDLMEMAGPLSPDIAHPYTAGLLQRVQQAADNSPDGTIPFEILKHVRTNLGDALTGKELIKDLPRRDAAIIRNAITEDLTGTIRTVAPQVLPDWNRANLFYNKGMDRIENVLNPLVAKNAPEQVMTALMSGTKDGATALRSTLRSLPAAEAGLVRSYALRQLGRAQEDAPFNPELFLRKFNGLAPTARTALFEDDQGTGDAIAALAKFAENRRAAGRVMFNPSGTAQNVSFNAIVNGLTNLSLTATRFMAASAGVGAMAGSEIAGSLGAATGAMATPLLASLGAKQIAERVFTNPRMIQWLVRQTKVPYGALAQELAILAKDSQKWGPNDRQIAQDFGAAMGAMDWRSILLASAAADATATR